MSANRTAAYSTCQDQLFWTGRFTLQNSAYNSPIAEPQCIIPLFRTQLSPSKFYTQSAIRAVQHGFIAVSDWCLLLLMCLRFVVHALLHHCCLR